MTTAAIALSAELLPPSIASRVFDAPGDFRAEDRACRTLEAAGFSVGHMQAGAPRGILFGAYDIQKWRNLDRDHRRGLHGVLHGDMRFGPLRAMLFASAPADAQRAFARVTALEPAI